MAYLYMAAAQAQDNTEVLDVTQRPFEELLNTEIITAAKLAHQISGAASAVSIVTAQDIQTYGYRTLDDILSSMRGLHMAHDYAYGYLGGRGYSNPGDYAGRITLLIDGYSAADNYFGQSYFGQDAFLDVELIDRVEYIPGGGSSDYGGGAFLGVINIVTKKGSDFNGTQVALDFASHDTQKQRVTWGQKYDNGAELLLSASAYSSAGHDIVTDPNSGTVGKAGEEANQRLFMKGSYQGWTLTSAVVQRNIHDPDLVGAMDLDTSGFASLKYDTELAPALKLSSHIYAGQYLYASNYGSDFPEDFQRSTGRWWGLDTKFLSTALDRQTLVWGVEYRDDYKQSNRIHWASGYYPDGRDLDVDVSRKTVSLYAYDDISLSPTTQLNVGLRREQRNNDTSFTSPRAALIYTPWAGSTFKLSSGIAHRQPTVEREKQWDQIYRMEQVSTHELVWEQRLSASTRLTSSIYRYDIDQIMQDGPDAGTLATKGSEFELERLWQGGSQLRLSYAWQQARNSLDQAPINSPEHIVKVNFTTPLVGEYLRLGLELQYLGNRPGYAGEDMPSATVANLALTSRNWWPQWHLSLSLRNAFDCNYADVAGPGNAAPTFQRDGRNLWLQISRDFK
jgi:iron complex outermembrane receptor protein